MTFSRRAVFILRAICLNYFNLFDEIHLSSTMLTFLRSRIDQIISIFFTKYIVNRSFLIIKCVKNYVIGCSNFYFGSLSNWEIRMFQFWLPDGRMSWKLSSFKWNGLAISKILILLDGRFLCWCNYIRERTCWCGQQQSQLQSQNLLVRKRN